MATKADIPIKCRLFGDVKKIVENIAIENNFVNFEIIVKEDDFSGDNFMGEISRVKIIPTSGNRNEINLILKRAPIDEAIRKLGTVQLFYRTEILMYKNIIPIFETFQEARIVAEERISFAKFYNAISDNMKELVILKDLTNDGYLMHDKRSPLNFEHAAIVIRKLATFHAISFALRRKEPALYSRITENIPRTVNFEDIFEKMLRCIVDKAVQVIDVPVNKLKVEAFTKNIHEYILQCLNARLTEPFNTLCHGDCWNNNILFQYKDGKPFNVICIDWQLARIASPVTDIIYFMSLSMDLKILRNNLQDLLNLYYGTLKMAASKMDCDIESSFPEDVFRKQFYKYVNFGLCASLWGSPLGLSDSDTAKPFDEIIRDIDRGVYAIDISHTAKMRLNELVDIFVTNKFI